MTMSENSGSLSSIEAVGKSPRWFAVVSEESLYELFGQMALKDNCPLACVQKGDITALRTFLSEGMEPQVIILDLSTSSSLLDDAKRALALSTENTRLIIIGKDDHVSIFRELKHIGVTDYLILPATEKDIRHALDEASLVPRVTAESAVKNARPFTAVIGVRGGVGASTIVVNSAWLTFNKFKKKVCIFDLDLYNSTVCILLDLIPNTGLNDAVSEISRVDEVFLKRVLLQKEEGFSVLTGQLGFEHEINFPVDAVSMLMDILRDSFEYVYLDVPFSTLHTPFTQTILSTVDNVIIVTDLTLVSVQALLRLRSFLATFFPHLQSKVIANNIFPNGGTISKEMLEKSTNLTLQTIFPYCKANILEGINSGEPFVKAYPSHAYTNQLNTFITSLYPQLKPVEQTKSFSFQKWLRLGK
ncbi:MAG: hypothetical protein A3F11_04685 [Gammaproteobacteria bacterium RIFCSPHIGHO2_12_FULL_37_14]|nr:MAG: hypothetical protein A3F11_04685 [Gammaproteobacteria bacterium RIFCSPHIGHO2_12_FULL_37_14]